MDCVNSVAYRKRISLIQVFFNILTINNAFIRINDCFYV